MTSNSFLRCLEQPGLIHPSACPLPGALMGKPSLPDTVTTSFVSGRFFRLDCSTLKMLRPFLMPAFDFLVQITYSILHAPLFSPGVCCWHQVGGHLPRSLQLCRSQRKSTAAGWAGLACGLPAAQCAASFMCTSSSSFAVHVHMQLWLNSVAAIWINWRAKKFLYLLAVHIDELFKSAVKWDKPLCSSFLLIDAVVGDQKCRRCTFLSGEWLLNKCTLV